MKTFEFGVPEISDSLSRDPSGAWLKVPTRDLYTECALCCLHFHCVCGSSREMALFAVTIVLYPAC